MPSPDLSIVLMDHQTHHAMPVADWMRRMAIPRIHFRAGVWAVTDVGLANLTFYCEIAARHLWIERDGLAWEDWMASQPWCLHGDFVEAIAAAREHHRAARPSAKAVSP